MTEFDMSTAFLDRRFLVQLQENPLDLQAMSATEAAHALFDFIQRIYGPGDECSLWSPTQAVDRGHRPFWRVSWEAGPVEWGVLLTLGESMWLTEFALRHDHRPEVMLQSGYGWYTEPHYRFDIGFIEEETGTGPITQRTGTPSDLLAVSNHSTLSSDVMRWPSFSGGRPLESAVNEL